MEIRENATYPYPIWGLKGGGFNGEAPDGTYVMNLDQANNELVFEYSLSVENEGIKRLVAEEQAVYMCIVECVPTYYLQKEKGTYPTIQVRIPADKVYKRITVKVLVVATKDIYDCDYLDVNAVYEGHVDYPKGGVVAYIDDLSFDLQQKDDETDLSRIFRTLPADVQKVEYSCDGEHVIIKYPKDSKANFESVEGYCPSVIEATFVYPALIFALGVLYQHYGSDRDWVYYLKNIVDDYCSKNDMEVPEEYRLEIEDVFDIADSILSNVHIMLLSETKNIIDQVLED